MTLEIRRILLISAAVAAIGVGAVLFVVLASRNTAGSSQRCGGSHCWGYRLEQYRFVNRTTLTLWGTWGLNLRYDLPVMSIERVHQDRWLATDRAIYLNLRFKPKLDPAATGDRVRLVYDFERGALNVASTLPLWRLPERGKNWMTDDEFDRLLISLEP